MEHTWSHILNSSLFETINNSDVTHTHDFLKYSDEINKYWTDATELQKWRNETHHKINSKLVIYKLRINCKTLS